MKTLIIDLPSGVVKGLQLAQYFNKLLSQHRSKIINEIMVNKLGAVLPPNKTYTLGLLYVASSLKKAGYDVDYRVIENTKDFDKLNIPISEYSNVLFSCKTTTYLDVLYMASKLKQKKAELKVILGGPHVMALPNEAIKNDCIDILVLCEGEFVILEILEAFKDNRYLQMNEIKGVCYKNVSNEIVFTALRALTSTLDDIPELDYSILPSSINNFHAYLEIGRGCLFNCSFCANSMLWKKKVRTYSVERSYKNLKHLSSLLPENALVHIVDPSFGFLDTHIELCEKLIKNPLPLKYSCDICATHVTKPVIKMLYNAGVRMFCVGIETADDEVLRFNRKPSSFENMRCACKIIRQESPAFIKTYWIAGLPGETENAQRKSRDAAIGLLKDNLIDLICEHIFMPYPGCDVFTSPQKYNYKIHHYNWRDYDARSFPLVGENINYSMERVYLGYLDFLRAQCEFYGLENRSLLQEMTSNVDFKRYKGSLI